MFRKRFDPRFVEMIRRQKRPIVIGLVCAAFVGLIVLATAAFLRWTIQAALEQDLQKLSQITMIVIVVFGLKYVFGRGQIYYLTMAAHRVTANLRKQIFAKLHSLPIAYFNTRRTGAIQSVLTNDVSVVQTGVPLVRDVVDAPLKVVGGITGLFILNWQLALVSLIAIPPVAMVIIRNSRKVRRLQAEVQQNLGDMTGTMQESLAGVRIVKSFSAEDREVERFDNAVEQTFRSNMRVVDRFARLKPTVELIGGVAIAGVMWFGGWLVINGLMGIEDLVAFVFLLDAVRNGSTGLSNMTNTYSQVQAAVDRIYDQVLDVETDIPDDADATILPDLKGRIEFNNVSFTYPDGTRALANVSFSIEPGRSTALVGRSGAGKSTIADLLLRFYDPTEGTITFDGVDIRRLDSRWLRRQFGVVPQQTLLFASTIHENIAFGKPDASEDDVRRAACLAHADDFIQATPEGYETVLGERGIRLSGGEMQRIAIARALLVEPTVLLLDEATSALDAVSERKVQEALDEIMRERTTLLIAHRLTTAARADQIIVLSQGSIVEKGSHQELLAMNGTYAGMYRAFNAGVFDGSLG